MNHALTDAAARLNQYAKPVCSYCKSDSLVPFHMCMQICRKFHYHTREILAVFLACN